MHWVLIRDSQGEFASQALHCTDREAVPWQILAWFVLRWQSETTFEEARRHIGLGTLWQRSELAIRGATPAVLRLVSLVSCSHAGD